MSRWRGGRVCVGWQGKGLVIWERRRSEGWLVARREKFDEQAAEMTKWKAAGSVGGRSLTVTIATTYEVVVDLEEVGFGGNVGATINWEGGLEAALGTYLPAGDKVSPSGT